jgi:hypothetical protein
MFDLHQDDHVLQPWVFFTADWLAIRQKAEIIPQPQRILLSNSILTSNYVRTYERPVCVWFPSQ